MRALRLPRRRRRDRRVRRPARRAARAGSRRTCIRWLVTVPCDSPFLPRDLVARLHARAGSRRTPTSPWRRPATSRIRCSALVRAVAAAGTSRQFLAGGGRKIDAWYASLKVVEVPFDDQADAFSQHQHAATSSPSTRKRTMSSLQQIVSCMDDYDPDALPVETARAVDPLARHAGDRAASASRCARASAACSARTSCRTLNVPAHDNSAMDGWAVRGERSRSRTARPTLREIGTSPTRARKFAGDVGPGKCVRVMTGAVMPPGTDTVVIQEVVQAEGDRIVVPPGPEDRPEPAPRRRGPRGRARRAARRAAVRPAELGLLASLGLAEVAVRRRLRVAFFSTGDELASIGAPLKEGEVYDSNRYTLYGMLARLGVELIDMGVVRDDPASLERAFTEAAAIADAIDHLRRRVGRRGRLHARAARPAGRGAVLEDRDAARAARWRSAGSSGNAAHFFGLPGNPVAVMVTFYGFVRDALLALAGRTDDYALPLLQRAERDRAAQEARAAPSSSAASSSATPTASGRCASPAARARASCARCPRRTASSCSSTSAAT